MKLWLDDIRPAPDGWHHVFTAWEAIAEIKQEYVTEVSLDHDLGNDEEFGTGYSVMRWLEEVVFFNPKFPVPDIKFHSDNPVGVQNMQTALDMINRIQNV